MTIRMILPALARVAVAAALASPFAAHAQSRAFYTSEVSTLAPEGNNQTLSLFRVEGRDNAGVLIGQRVCGPLTQCNSFFEGAAKSVVVFDVDTAREQVVSETCKGVPSTVPQLRCEDGDLVVRVRMLLGEIALRHVTTTPAEGPRLNLNELRGIDLAFAEDTRRSRPVSDGRGTVVANGVYPAVAGRYVASLRNELPAHCKPRVLDNALAITVPAGGRATLEFVYRGTECLVHVLAEPPPADLVLRSDTTSFTCTAATPSAASPYRSLCTALAPFNRPMVITATVPAGREPVFRTGNNHCSAFQPDRTRCAYTPTRDLFLYASGSREFIDMETRAAGAPVVPEPVALSLAPGAASPADSAVVKGSVSVPMLQLRATATNGTAMLGSLTLKANGNGRDDLDLTMVKLVVDANGNGAFDAGETVLAQARPTADNGEVRLLLGSAVPIAAGTDLLVVADIASDVHPVAALLSVSGVVLAMGLVAWPVARRRPLPRALGVGLAASLVLAVAAGLAGCGGGDAAAEDPVSETPPEAPAPSPPPAVLVTYRLDLTAFSATDTGTPPRSIAGPALVEGATVTVRQ